MESEASEEVIIKLKKSLLKYYKKGPADVKEFLYGWERKRYFKKDLRPKLNELINFMTATVSFIECEHANSFFIQKMLETAALILISYNMDPDNILDEAKESWIVKLMIKSKELKELKPKIEELEFQTLRLLNMICKFRCN